LRVEHGIQNTPQRRQGVVAKELLAGSAILLNRLRLRSGVKIMSKTKRAKWSRSKALECAARYLVQEGIPLTAATVYDNMRYKNDLRSGEIGNLYRVNRSAQSYMQVAMRMMRCPAFKKQRTSPREPYVFSCDKETYDKWWPEDPLKGLSR
jgi:hypothetical protein